MKLKRVLTTGMLLTALALLVACGANSTNTGEKDEKVDKITIFQSKVEITDDLKALAEEYKKEKGITVEIWGTTGDGYIAQAKTRLSNKASGPSIFSSAGAMEGEQLKSYMADMSKAEFVSNIADNKAFEVDGKVLGLPYSVEGYGLIVNKNLVDPANLKTIDQFVDFLKQSKSDGKFTGFELSQESYFLIGHMLNTAFALQKDQRKFIEDVDEGTVKLQDVEEFKELAKAYEAIREYTNNPLEVNYDKQIGDLMTKKTASVNQGMWINMLTASYSDPEVQLEMVPFPFDGNDKLAVDVPQFWHVNGQKSEAEIQASLDFLNWLTSSEVGQDYIVNKFKMIPAMKNIKIDESKMDVLSKAVYDSTQSGNNIPWSFPYWPMGIIDTNLVQVAQKFFTDKSMSGIDFITQLSEQFVEASKTK